jgi:hypothetical protein
MKKIILHVGTHKTGSTSIQETFYKNRHILENNGIHYLSIGSNHWDLYSAFMEDPYNWFENKKLGLDEKGVDRRNHNALSTVKEELENCIPEVVIISAEHISLLSESCLSQLKNYLESFGNVEVVYYCREIMSWLSSDSQQCAKVGMKSEPTIYSVAINRLYEFPMKFITVFGRNNFNLVKFEDAVKVGLCNSLLSLFDLPTLEKIGIKENRENTSISGEAVEAFYMLNEDSHTSNVRRSERFVNILRNMPGNKYVVRNLTKEQVEDHNLKNREMREKYGFEMYPDLEFKPAPHSFEFSKESVRYLVNKFNQICWKYDEVINGNEDYLITEKLPDILINEAIILEKDGSLIEAKILYNLALKYRKKSKKALNGLRRIREKTGDPE